MAWRRTGDKPLPEPMLTQVTEHIYAVLVEDELNGLRWRANMVGSQYYRVNDSLINIG